MCEGVGVTGAEEQRYLKRDWERIAEQVGGLEDQTNRQFVSVCM